MSLATHIKDFADLLHNIYAQQLSSLEGTDIMSDGVFPLTTSKFVVLQQICLYGAKSCFSGVLYFLSFQWLRDFSYLPLNTPEIGNESFINHDTFLSEPFSYLFSFAKNGVTLSPYVQSEAWQEGARTSASALETGIQQDVYARQGFTTVFNHFLKSDQLLAGFVNSFFFSFPFSLPNLITLRRMFSQGLAAAAASTFGTIAGHSLMIIGVLYGIRFLIVPYYSLQPLTFLIGIITIAIVITEFVKEKRIYLVQLTRYPSLLRIGVLNFILALCESSTVFHDLHHLTLNEQSTYLQLYESQNVLDSFLINTAYLIAFILGHAFFSLGFSYFLLKINVIASSLAGWRVAQTARRINQGLLLAILTLTLSCFPYYGLDYLFTKSAGFLPEDPAYRNTIFSPTQVRSRTVLFKRSPPEPENPTTPLELDLSYFDRGMYINAPKEEKEDITTGDSGFIGKKRSPNFGGKSPSTKEEKTRGDSEEEETRSGHEEEKTRGDSDSVGTMTSSKEVETLDPSLTFESLNYHGESAWLMRNDRVRLPDEEEGSSKKESFFKITRNNFKQRKLEQENKQAEAALTEFPQIGSISGWKEGNRPGERVALSAKNLSTSLSKKAEDGPSGKLHSPNPQTSSLGKTASERSFLLSLPEKVGVEQNSFAVDEAQKNENKSSEEQGRQLSRSGSKETFRGDNFSSGRAQKRLFLKERAFEEDIESNYEKSFALPFIEDSEERLTYLTPIENIIKKRYRVNPVYRALLQTDIDLFIARQPANYKITQNQEASLFKKRQLLERYYNSIRYYSPVESVAFTERHLARATHNDFRSTGNEISGKEIDHNQRDERVSSSYNANLHPTKSFIETVYHQQFKGTFTTIKRFFKVTFDEEQNPNQNRVLSYDQPLYKKSNLSSSFAVSEAQKKREEGGRNTFDEMYHPSLHEELDLEMVSPFIEESNSAPIYAGWDEKARRFVITNRFNLVE